ncbi:MAG: hypothetical protein RLZZ129_1346 [Verrucomicrobiota bacterium]|jgi:hypothetical protein
MPRWLPLCTAAAALLAFVATLGGGFLGDDFAYIARFHALPFSNWPALFFKEWSGGLWGYPLVELRPVTALSFIIDSRLFGGDATGYRLMNLVCHAATTAVVTMLAWKYGAGNIGCALVAGLVFAFHPSHAEAVAWITGRVDVLPTLGGLLFWLASGRWEAGGSRLALAAAMVALAAGLFAKEMCLFAPALLLLLWVTAGLRADRALWRRRIVLLVCVAGLLAIYAVCRRLAFGGEMGGTGTPWENEDAWRRQLSYFLWIFPVLPIEGVLQFEGLGRVPLIKTVLAVLGIATVLGLGLATWKAKRTAATVIFFTAGWWLITIGGLLFVPYFSPRHLYFPSTGLAIGLALVLSQLGRRLRWPIAAMLLAWVATAHYHAIQPWILAGQTSRQLSAKIAATHGPDSLLLTSVPNAIGPAWMWAWASPFAFGPPFQEVPPAPESVFVSKGNHFNPDRWTLSRGALLAAISDKAHVSVIAVDPDGRIHHRSIERTALAEELQSLATTEAHVISDDEWNLWVHSLTRPPPVNRNSPL